MAWLVATSTRTDLAAVRAEPVWREVRRFSAPVQLAVAAAHDAVRAAQAPGELALVALAPCRGGSPELHRWVHDIHAAAEGAAAVKMNPTHTLHAVDNLALSVMSLALGSRGWGLGLGGAPGMMWSALELVHERPEAEVLVFAGDEGAGVALRFARAPAAGRSLRLIGVERSRLREATTATAHAADGAIAMLAALPAQLDGRFRYRVPDAHGDGLDAIDVVWELGSCAS